MKKITTFLFVCLILSNYSFAQSSIEWQRSFGGSKYDYVHEIEHTADGGYVTAGYSESVNGDITFTYGAGDCLVIKYNASGTIQWQKTFGGTAFDYGYSVRQTADGGYVVAGYTESNDGDVIGNHGNGDCWILKLDAAGTIEWQKTYGGTSADNAQSIRQTADGGYIVCGYTESTNGDVTTNHGGGDCWVLRLDNAGTILWQKTLGGSDYDFGQSIRQTVDGGYIVAAETNSNNGDVTLQHGNGDCWLVKLDSAGNIEWQNSFGGTNSESSQSIQQTTDEGYIVAGYSESNDGDVTGSHGGGDCWILKCNKFGALQWEKSLGSSGNDYAYCIHQLASGGYILTGYSELNDGDVAGNHGSFDCWLVNLDAAGNVVWQKSLGGTGVDIGYSIEETTDGGYIVAGYSESNDGDVSGNHGNGDCWIVKISQNSLGINEKPSQNSVFVSQNSDVFNFSGLKENSTIEIYDISGKLILQVVSENSNYNIDMSNDSKGVYVYRVNHQNENIKTGKLILY
ncbi:MAG: T9SS type A sorting domain-containing protein [Bacteroidia bacterium]